MVRLKKVMLLSFATKVPKADPVCAKCCRQHPRSWAKDWARMSRSLPTADFPVAAMAMSLGISHMRLMWAGRWPSFGTVIPLQSMLKNNDLTSIFPKAKLNNGWIIGYSQYPDIPAG